MALSFLKPLACFQFSDAFDLECSMACFSSTVWAALWALIDIRSPLSLQSCQIKRPGQPSGQIPGSQQPERALSSWLILMLGQGSGCTRKRMLPFTVCKAWKWKKEGKQAGFKLWHHLLHPYLRGQEAVLLWELLHSLIFFWRGSFPEEWNECIKKEFPELVAEHWNESFVCPCCLGVVHSVLKLLMSFLLIYEIEKVVCQVHNRVRDHRLTDRLCMLVLAVVEAFCVDMSLCICLLTRSQIR